MKDTIWNSVAIKQCVKGVLTWLPWWQYIRRKEGGGASGARYCYAVWMRHLLMAKKFGLTVHPEVVAEFGPGDSIGTGLAALLSGSRVYLALDVLPYTNISRNLQIFDELVQLYRNRTPIPDDLEFPDYFPMQGDSLQDLYPRLESYRFPDQLIPANDLGRALEEGRLAAIRGILSTGRIPEGSPVQIRYEAPWDDPGLLQADSVDLIFTQAVMEHVDRLAEAYEVMNRWLRPGGVISHEIDFKCHGIATRWNGHWAYPDSLWRIMRGNRPYFLNRTTCGSHLEQIGEAGFDVTWIRRQKRVQGIRRSDLCASLSSISDEDLMTSAAHIVARKKIKKGNN